MFFHIFTPVALGIFMNFIIYSFQINRSSVKIQNKNPLIPPGYIIGTIWVILLGCMGMAHYILSITTSRLPFYRNYAILCLDFLIGFSILYPIITGLKNNQSFFLLLSLAITLLTSLVVKFYSITAFYYLIPLILWVIYVNVATYLYI